MNNLKMAENIIRQSDGYIINPDLLYKARINECNFTRSRRLICHNLVLLIIYGIKKPLKHATEKMFEQLGQVGEAVSMQTVSKA